MVYRAIGLHTVCDVNAETIANVMAVRNQALLIHEIPPHSCIQRAGHTSAQ